MASNSNAQSDRGRLPLTLKHLAFSKEHFLSVIDKKGAAAAVFEAVSHGWMLDTDATSKRARRAARTKTIAWLLDTVVASSSSDAKPFAGCDTVALAAVTAWRVPSCLSRVLDLGADPTLPDAFDVTPLTRAVCNVHLGAVNALLRDPRVQKEVRDKAGSDASLSISVPTRRGRPLAIAMLALLYAHGDVTPSLYVFPATLFNRDVFEATTWRTRARLVRILALHVVRQPADAVYLLSKMVDNIAKEPHHDDRARLTRMLTDALLPETPRRCVAHIITKVLYQETDDPRKVAIKATLLRTVEARAKATLVAAIAAAAAGGYIDNITLNLHLVDRVVQRM